jgi:hypothetical protein
VVIRRRKRRKKRPQYPSETYSARILRDKLPTPVTLSATDRKRLDVLARAHSISRGEVISRLLDLIDEVEDLPTPRKKMEADEIVIHDRVLPKIGK